MADPGFDLGGGVLCQEGGDRKTLCVEGCSKIIFLACFVPIAINFCLKLIANDEKIEKNLRLGH